MNDGKPKCACGSSSNVIIYSCSGASNVGQLANEVTIEMAKAGKGSMGCLVGLAAHVSTMVQNAKGADQVLVIDGCGVKCGRKALEHAGISDFASVVITELGVKKNYDLRADHDKMPELVEQISAMVRTARPITIGEEPPKGGCGCGC